MYSSSHLGRQTPVGSHRPRLAGRQRERMEQQLLTPKLSERGGGQHRGGKENVPRNAWPLVFRQWQLPSPSAPPATNPAPPRPPALRWGELGTPSAGSAWQLGCTPCHTRAGPWPVTAHRPLHLPLGPTALGHSSSNTQQQVYRCITELPPSS